MGNPPNGVGVGYGPGWLFEFNLAESWIAYAIVFVVLGASLLVERAWCRYACPPGGVISPAILVVTLLGSVWISQATGVWSISGRTEVDVNDMTPADLKGWMTLQQVMDGLHISQAELYALGNIPADVPPTTALKDLEGLVPDKANNRKTLRACGSVLECRAEGR